MSKREKRAPLVAVVILLVAVLQDVQTASVYGILNNYHCASYRSSYSGVCGFGIYREPKSLFMHMPTTVKVNTAEVEIKKTRWSIEHVPGEDKNVVRISDADCDAGRCGYWYTDQFGVYILYMDEDRGDMWRLEKTADGDYFIRGERNCDKPGKPWPCRAYLTWFPRAEKYYLYLNYNDVGFNRWKMEKEEKIWPG